MGRAEWAAFPCSGTAMALRWGTRIAQLGWRLCAQDSSSTMSSPWKSPGAAIQALGTCKQENVLAPRGEEDDATLGKKADTSSCHRDPVVTMQPLRSPSPCRTWARGGLSGSCRVSDHRGHHDLAAGSLEGRPVPTPAGLAARQGRMG